MRSCRCFPIWTWPPPSRYCGFRVGRRWCASESLRVLARDVHGGGRFRRRDILGKTAPEHTRRRISDALEPAATFSFLCNFIMTCRFHAPITAGASRADSSPIFLGAAASLKGGTPITREAETSRLPIPLAQMAREQARRHTASTSAKQKHSAGPETTLNGARDTAGCGACILYPVRANPLAVCDTALDFQLRAYSS